MESEVDQVSLDLDSATVLWFKESQEGWELTKAEELFKQHEVWDYEQHEPDWHSIQRKAFVLGRVMASDKGSD